ncbi:hypothetical protein L1987_69327 [Smallanthus sonchifolius]|uniref:Uncharacterized protein n=1 Tax=Smallanthus sonchifolius TaxID=185202 RepID=A0ACB9B5A8_9ASTR|nr:hypothetical protein L1987_69327 [Smallanthus sonchifolius]
MITSVAVVMKEWCGVDGKGVDRGHHRRRRTASGAFASRTHLQFDNSEYRDDVDSETAKMSLVSMDVEPLPLNTEHEGKRKSVRHGVDRKMGEHLPEGCNSGNLINSLYIKQNLESTYPGGGNLVNVNGFSIVNKTSKFIVLGKTLGFTMDGTEGDFKIMMNGKGGRFVDQ